VACRNLPYSGVYLLGGVTAKMADFITEPTRLSTLLHRYLHTGACGNVLHDVIRNIPLFLVKDEGLGMRGAWVQAVRTLQGRLCSRDRPRPTPPSTPEARRSAAGEAM